MSIFRGPGILLNRVTVHQPAHLPTLFDLALKAKGSNLCAVRDELGAIAYSLHENGKTDEGNELFEILESGYMLLDQRDDILKCMGCATPQILADALFRSGRYIKSFEIPPIKRGRRRTDDIPILKSLLEHESQAVAARALGISSWIVNNHIVHAAEGSILCVFQRVFKTGMRTGKHWWSNRKVSDVTIYDAIMENGTLTAAAETLGVTRQCISFHIKMAGKDSPLYKLKGTFKRGRPKRDS